MFRLFNDLRTFVAKSLCRDLPTFSADFFVTEKQTPQTFSLLECMPAPTHPGCPMIPNPGFALLMTCLQSCSIFSKNMINGKFLPTRSVHLPYYKNCLFWGGRLKNHKQKLWLLLWGLNTVFFMYSPFMTFLSPSNCSIILSLGCVKVLLLLIAPITHKTTPSKTLQSNSRPSLTLWKKTKNWDTETLDALAMYKFKAFCVEYYLVDGGPSIRNGGRTKTVVW